MAQSPPHIAIYLRTIFDCGVDRVMINLARGFVQRGLKVDLVLNSVGGCLLSQFPAQVRIIDLKAPRLLTSLPDVIGYLKKEKPLALLSSGHYVNEVALWAKSFSLTSTRLVVSEHNILSVNAKLTTHERLSPLLAKLFYGWADGIIAVSQGVAKDLVSITNLDPSRIRVIYNPIITPELLDKSQELPDHPWFQPGEPPVILGVGRLEPQKDFPTLIRAFAQVRRIKPCRLVILGRGKEKAKLEALIRELDLENEVVLLGFVNNPYAYIAKAAVFVLSSVWEGLPTVIIEAMALNTPVISTDCESGPAEILAEGKYGFLVPVGDSKAMAEKILNVLSDNYSPSIPANWLEQFTLKTATEKYLDTLGINI
ncbi:MAG: glycosyltransferase [Cyanobacteria bacterium J083]|nr:MAG: glycosyltransferase [Cyanobacteria bacterium J083]